MQEQGGVGVGKVEGYEGAGRGCGVGHRKRRSESCQVQQVLGRHWYVVSIKQ